MTAAGMARGLASLMLVSLPALATARTALLPDARPAASTLVLKAGTPVPLTLVGAISSKTHKQGERFDLVVEEDVRVGGRIAIPRGAAAQGEIAAHTAKGPFGKSGRVELRLLHVMVDGRRVRLDGSDRRKGSSSGVPAVATGVAVGLIGPFITGKTAAIPAGTRVTGYVHRDLALASAN